MLFFLQVQCLPTWHGAFECFAGLLQFFHLFIYCMARRWTECLFMFFHIIESTIHVSKPMINWYKASMPYKQYYHKSDISLESCSVRYKHHSYFQLKEEFQVRFPTTKFLQTLVGSLLFDVCRETPQDLLRSCKSNLTRCVKQSGT